MQVLFADGDEGSLEVAQRYLWICGHEAKVATNGLECVDILRREDPDARYAQIQLHTQNDTCSD